MAKYENRRYYGGNSYAPAPSAPSLDITINQHTGNPSPYKAPNNRRPPPMMAPPPPPVYGASSIYSEPMWIDKFSQKKNRGMFRACLIQVFLSAALLACGIWALRDAPLYLPYYSAIWAAAIFLLNSVAGSLAARYDIHNLYLAHLALSITSILIAVVSAMLAARHWYLLGTDKHPTVNRNTAFCFVASYDANRISYIFNHMKQYNFAECAYQLKVGLAVNSAQIVVSVIIAFLNMISFFMCLKRTCINHCV